MAKTGYHPGPGCPVQRRPEDVSTRLVNPERDHTDAATGQDHRGGDRRPAPNTPARGQHDAAGHQDDGGGDYGGCQYRYAL